MSGAAAGGDVEVETGGGGRARHGDGGAVTQGGERPGSTRRRVVGRAPFTGPSHPDTLSCGTKNRETHTQHGSCSQRKGAPVTGEADGRAMVTPVTARELCPRSLLGWPPGRLRLALRSWASCPQSGQGCARQRDAAALPRGLVVVVEVTCIRGHRPPCSTWLCKGSSLPGRPSRWSPWGGGGPCGT